MDILRRPEVKEILSPMEQLSEWERSLTLVDISGLTFLEPGERKDLKYKINQALGEIKGMKELGSDHLTPELFAEMQKSIPPVLEMLVSLVEKNSDLGEAKNEPLKTDAIQ